MKPEDNVNHRVARSLLSAFAFGLAVLAVPLITKSWEVLILILCMVTSAALLVDDVTWVIKWLRSNHTSQRGNKK